jgi:hypothetical protein
MIMTALKNLSAGGLLIAFFLGRCQGQGRLPTQEITFDLGLSAERPSQRIISNYYDGLFFTQVTDDCCITRTVSGIWGYPDNGTAYLVSITPLYPIVCRFPNGEPFSLVSIDLAEYSTVVPEANTARVTGYRVDGSIVVAQVTTDGIIDGVGPLADFQTFHFRGFSSLIRLEISADPGLSIDSLAIRWGPDQDDDAVGDFEDRCPESPLAAIVNDHGCSIDQLVPCNARENGRSWSNHGQYVSQVKAVADSFVEATLLTPAERDALVREAARSTCGKR